MSIPTTQTYWKPGTAKLSPDQRKKIEGLLNSTTDAVLARAFNLSRQRVGQIRKELTKKKARK
jgi:hypothetical protein